MISDKYKAIFIHVPKTASTSIRNVLEKNSFCRLKQAKIKREPNLVKSGGNANRLRPSISFDSWSNYLKFAFVRNPYSRVYSAWKMLQNDKRHNLDFESFIYILNNLLSFKLSSDVLSLRGRGVLKYWMLLNWMIRGVDVNSAYIIWHTLPQITHLSIDGKITVDYIGRYERLDDDFQLLCSKLSIKPTPKLPLLNSTKNVNIKDVYSSKLKNVVYEIYEKDFLAFGYDKNKIG